MAVLEPDRQELADWRSYATGPLVIGPVDAPVTLTVFSDFQCLFCARFAHSLQRLRNTRGVSIRIVYRNAPNVKLHPAARVAAMHAVCAAEQGMFERMHDVLFANPDAVAVGRWPWIRGASGIRDAAQFDACLRDAATAAVVRNDSLDAARLRLVGTPTLIVNQWRVRAGNPPDSILERLIDSAKTGARQQ